MIVTMRIIRPVVILVGVNLLPTVANQVAGAQANSNITGADDSIIGLSTTFFALGIMSAGVTIAIGGLRSAGIM